jgi:hypothetical protein
MRTRLRTGEKSVTIKTERPDRCSLGYRVLQSRNSVKHAAVTTITENEMLHLVSYVRVPGRKTPRLLFCKTPDSRKGRLGSLED